TGFSAREIVAARASPSRSGIATISTLQVPHRTTCTAFRTLTTTPPRSSVCTGRIDRSINPPHFLQRMTLSPGMLFLSLSPRGDDLYFWIFVVLIGDDDRRYSPPINVRSFRSPTFLAIAVLDIGDRASLQHVLDIDFGDVVVIPLHFGMIRPPDQHGRVSSK